MPTLVGVPDSAREVDMAIPAGRPEAVYLSGVLPPLAAGTVSPTMAWFLAQLGCATEAEE
ncbi:MAG: hypothetical protein OXI74_14260 [Rhodospirillaceae bacterium]|nr:hypothetical protein [Rhodospirillaceae bacterium]